jgi:ribonuclease HII
MTTNGNQTVRFIGIDEAGYGPNLGPLVIACVAFDGPAEFRDCDWWEVLAPTVGRRADAVLPIDDSKRLFGHPRGMEGAGRTISALLRLLNRSSATLSELFAALAPTSADDLCCEHWHRSDASWAATPIQEAGGAFEAAGLRLAFLESVAVFPSRFNERLASTGNKAAVEAEVVQLLLQKSLAAAPSHSGAVAVVDRLGGRKFYRDLVEELACDAFVLTHCECAACSDYAYEDGLASIEVSFRTKADGDCLPVALASVVAKYLREAAMQEFNAYWQTVMPELRPTAGYPEDARRFRAEILEAWERLDRPMSELWRER